jgi:hypothetical protein
MGLKRAKTNHIRWKLYDLWDGKYSKAETIPYDILIPRPANMPQTFVEATNHRQGLIARYGFRIT